MKAKLTAEIVADIRKRLSQGEAQRLVARRYGITTDHVSAIQRGVCWKETAIPMRGKAK